MSPPSSSVTASSAHRLTLVSEKSSFSDKLSAHGLQVLRRDEITTLQINVGKRCNMACHHCHVEAGPKRTEEMTARTVDRLIELVAATPSVCCIDLTGGAPELNQHFERFVKALRGLGRRVIDRCNLTVLFETGQENTAAFLAGHQVEVVASLPCYQVENVEAQRGKGAFDKSIEGLRWLNRLGYGQAGSELKLDLVYNPVGAALPPAQAGLQEKYREELARLYQIQFHSLLTITNMPIRRFAYSLKRDGKLHDYQQLLVSSFNPDTLTGLMCRNLVSVGWDGSLYDCDFNQMLEMPLAFNPQTIWQITSLTELNQLPIATAAHCFGCTAGAGSSCSGALQ